IERDVRIQQRLATTQNQREDTDVGFKKQIDGLIFLSREKGFTAYLRDGKYSKAQLTHIHNQLWELHQIMFRVMGPDSIELHKRVVELSQCSREDQFRWFIVVARFLARLRAWAGDLHVASLNQAPVVNIYRDWHRVASEVEQELFLQPAQPTSQMCALGTLTITDVRYQREQVRHYSDIAELERYDPENPEDILDTDP
ncbi:MAG: hypothetical protein AAF525_07020, partial [Pseudomonadota bacterium]